MTITIEHLRVSWIRALSLPSVVGATVRPGPSIGSSTGYSDAYTAAAGPAAVWRRPWEADGSFSKLWKRNLQLASYRAADAGRAWRRLVPLWSAAPTSVRWRGGGTGAVAVDRYLLPGAVALVVTVDLAGSFTPAEALAAVAAAHDDAAYGLGGQSLSLPRLFERLFDDVTRGILGAADPGSTGDADPLSIVTVLAASGSPGTAGPPGADEAAGPNAVGTPEAEPPTAGPDVAGSSNAGSVGADETALAAEAAVAQDNAMHRLLHGLAAVDADALGTRAGERLQKASLTQSERADGGTLYAFHRGRAVWSPAKMFSAKDRPKLACYHHNLVVSSAIAEALLAFVGDAAARSRGQAGYDIGKLAANVLGLLYGPAKDMWSSTSIRRQIDDSGAVPTIDELRQSHDWAPLSARTPKP